MRKMQRYVALVSALLVSVATTGCGTWSQRDKNTAIGAGAGAVAGSVLTGGSTTGTLGGAAVGGVIGHQIGK